MGERIEFTSNYSNVSTDQGFQFEFFCDRCGSGYRTQFQSPGIGMINSALDTASSLFGGIFGQRSDVSRRVQSASWERAHDAAFSKAIKEIKPEFIQCPRCSSWVCHKSCWNVDKGLCKECAPDLGDEMAAFQSSRTVAEIRAHSKMAEEDREMLKESSWWQGVKANCPECNAPLPKNVKICP